MKPIRSTILAAALAAAVEPAAAQSGDFYAGKTLKITVGLEAGGTVDTLARLMVGHLRRHIPGKHRGAVAVDRGLAGAEQDALPAIDDLALVEAELQGPLPRVHCCALHHALPRSPPIIGRPVA